MRNNPITHLRAGRAKAFRDGQAAPVAFFWDDPELLTDAGTDAFHIWFNDLIDDWYGISSAMIVEALLMAGGQPVIVHLNSPGGLVFEGLAIHSAFKQYAGKVTMRVEGLAASAASFVMLAGDEILIEPSAMVMVHDASDVTIGSAADHRLTADLLDKISDNLAGMYATKAGGDAADWRGLMTVNGAIGTWYTGQEAVDAGLVDRLADADPVEAPESAAVARDRGRWQAAYAARPAAVAEAPVVTLPIPAPAPRNITTSAVPETKEPDQPAWWATLQSGLKGVRQ